MLVRDGLDATDVVVGMPGFADEQKRVIAATVGGVRVVCVYVPNGQAVGSDKYCLQARLVQGGDRGAARSARRASALAVVGDFNVAPEDRDVHDPALWAGQVLFSEPERAAFRALLDSGSSTASACFDQPPKTFSWWDYRSSRSRRTTACASTTSCCRTALAARCTACRIDRNARKGEKPSRSRAGDRRVRRDA